MATKMIGTPVSNIAKKKRHQASKINAFSCRNYDDIKKKAFVQDIKVSLQSMTYKYRVDDQLGYLEDHLIH